MTGMTGFGRSESSFSNYQIIVEIKSYNSKHLEVDIRVPRSYSVLEPKIRTVIQGRVRRGHVELSVIVVNSKYTRNLEVDVPAAEAYISALKKLAVIVDGDPVTLSHLLAVRGFIVEENPIVLEGIWPDCRIVLEEALNKFESSRLQDGDVTVVDIVRLIEQVSEELDLITEESQTSNQEMRESMVSRATKLMGESVDKDLLLTALATLIVKADVNEETVRINGHLTAFKEGVEQVEGAKKLEFISQEMMREFNTIAAKASGYPVSAAAIRAKDCVEKIREHLRNIE